MSDMISVEFRINHIFIEVNNEDRIRSKIKTYYKRKSENSFNPQSIDLIFKKIKNIRVGGETYLVRGLIYDFDIFGGKVIVMFREFNESYTRDKVFNPTGWEEIKREVLESKKIGITAKRNRRLIDDEFDEDEL